MGAELWGLALQGLRKRRRSTLLLFLVLLLSLVLAVVTLSVTGSIAETNEAYRLDTYGEWQLGIMSGVRDDCDYITSGGWLDRLGTAAGYGVVSAKLGSFGIGTADSEFLSLGHISTEAGHMPEQPGEIAMEADMLHALGYYDPKPGDEITLPITFPCQPDGVEDITKEATFTLSGVIREYASVWNLTNNVEKHLLNSAFVLESDLQMLRSSASQELEERRFHYMAKVSQLKEAGAEPSLYDEAMTKSDFAPPNYMYIFTTLPHREEHVIPALKSYLLDARRGTHADRSPCINEAARQSRQEADINYVYTALVYAVTLLAVLCIYAIQLQKQARQIALFRSIGITKRQLRVTLLYETLIICLPAFLLGIGGGVLGTRLLLEKAIYSQAVPVRLVIPGGPLLGLLLIWLSGVLAARLLLFQLALRVPLTGRMGLDRGKARLSVRAQQAAVGALSVLLCAAACFTADSAADTARQLRDKQAEPAYEVAVRSSDLLEITMDKAWLLGSGGDPNNNVVRVPLSAYTEEALYSLLETTPYPFQVRFFNLTEDIFSALRKVPGVTDVKGYGILDVALREGGLEDTQFYLDCWDADRLENKYLGLQQRREERTAFLYGRAIQAYILPEGDWSSYFSEADVDLEKFRRGECVVTAFPIDAAGNYILDYPVLLDEETGQYTTEQRSYSDTGLRVGDTITLRFYDNTRKWSGIRIHPLNTVDVEVGHIMTVPTSAKQSGPVKVTQPYTILCSQSFVERAMDAMPYGYAINYYFTGDLPDLNRGFGYAYLYTDLNADYVGADAAVTRICDEGELSLTSHMAQRTAAIQGLLQQPILTLAAGGCILLVLLLIIGNSLTLQTERERRKYGILQSLGMSRRQLWGRLAGSAALWGLVSALCGLGAFGGYAAFRTGRPVSLPVLLSVSALSAALICGLFLASRRGLFRDDLMAKLRDEE